MSKHFVLIGPPGSGKGTQAPAIATATGACHISTGDLLRDSIRAGTENGKKAKTIMDKGELIPDELMILIISEKLASPECKHGWILDGFPRTAEQAKKFDDMLVKSGEKVDLVLEFHVADSLLVKRITGRWIHPASGRSYHTEFQPPKKPGVDDVTGEPLIQRSDDTEDVLVKRLKVYHERTEPIIQHYKEMTKFFEIDGSKSVKEVWALVSPLL